MKYELIRSNRKTISLIINKEAQLIVRAPAQVSQKYIEDYILSKQSWIVKNINKMQVYAQNSKPKEYFAGEIFMLFGREYPLLISSIDNEITVLNGKIIFPSKYLADSKTHMTNWYIALAKEYIIPRTKIIAKQINLTPNKIKITRADKRWGSCSSKKNINFSYKLAMANEKAIDYVIIHELCHLKYMDHSYKFWGTVNSLMPDYKIQRKYLKENDVKFRL